MWVLYESKQSPEVIEAAETRMPVTGPNSESRVDTGIASIKWCLSIGLCGSSTRISRFKRKLS